MQCGVVKRQLAATDLVTHDLIDDSNKLDAEAAVRLATNHRATNHKEQ